MSSPPRRFARPLAVVRPLLKYDPARLLGKGLPVGIVLTIRITGNAVRFSAAHFLVFDADSCESLHGHDFRVEALIEAGLAPTGWVFDFIAAHKLLMEIVGPMDHKTLLPSTSRWLKVEVGASQVTARLGDRTWQFPSGDCCLLPIDNTTAELLAAHIGEQYRRALQTRYSFSPEKLCIEVYETPEYSACWSWQA